MPCLLLDESIVALSGEAALSNAAFTLLGMAPLGLEIGLEIGLELRLQKCDGIL